MTDAENRTPPSRASSHPVLWFLVGGGAVLLCALGLSLLLRDRTPVLTRDNLQENFRTWRKNRFASYELDLSKEADRMDRESFHVTVRSGKVVRLVHNGNEVPPNTYYSIEGLFDLLRRELDMAEDTEPESGQRHDAMVKAAFQGELGFPVVIKVFASEGQSFVLRVEELRVPDEGVIYSADTDATADPLSSREPDS